MYVFRPLAQTQALTDYTDFVTQYYNLLSKVEEYFKGTSIDAVLELVNDTTCNMLQMEMECDKQHQKLCPDPRTSSSNILTDHKAMNKLKALPNFKKFMNGEEFTITEIFGCLQGVHPTHCLAAAVHYTLHQKLFDKFKESQSGVANLFLVEHKKFFTSIMGCTYDAGKKLTKVGKKEKEAKEMELK